MDRDLTFVEIGTQQLRYVAWQCAVLDMRCGRNRNRFIRSLGNRKYYATLKARINFTPLWLSSLGFLLKEIILGENGTLGHIDQVYVSGRVIEMNRGEVGVSHRDVGLCYNWHE